MGSEPPHPRASPPRAPPSSRHYALGYPTVGAKPERPRVAGSQLSHPNAGVGARGWLGALGCATREAAPNFLPSSRWRQKPSPKAELEPSRQGAPPAPCPPGPHSPRVPRALPPSPRGCRSPCSGPPGHPRVLPCSAGPTGAGRAQGAARAAVASSRALPAARGPVLLPGPPGGRRRQLGLLPRPREGGAWGGKWEAGRALPGGASSPTGGAGALSRPPPAAWSPPLARLGTLSDQSLGAPSIRGWNPRVRTFQARTSRIGTPLVLTLPRLASPEPLAPPSSLHPALRAADAGCEGWAQPRPAGP